MKKLLCAISALLCCAIAQGQQILDLSGPWQFSTTDSVRFDDAVLLPGSMLTNGKGDDVSVNTQWTGSLYDSSFYFNPFMEKYRHEGQMKFPFFLTPEKHYVGVAWYKRIVYVPKEFKGRRITLFLERPHIETTAYVNGHLVGHQLSLSTPHRYDVTRLIKAGKKNEILIRVYNGIENVCVGQDSHSVTDQTQGNWNGITGRIELQAQWKKLNIKGIKVELDSFPVRQHNIEREDGTIIKGKKELVYWGKVFVKLENHVDGVRFMPLWDYNVNLSLAYATGSQKGKVISRSSVSAKGDEIEFGIFFGDKIQPWDEFHPNLYRLRVEAGDDVYETLIGFRRMGVEGRQLQINGRPLFLRGTVENCCFPETGYPPTDEAEWLRIFKKCKEYGINHMRFHSYCPPEAAFAAADQVGIYLQPEGPSWPNHGVKLRRGQKIDQYLLEESKRIIDEYGHHPSFLMMAAGNEPAGDWVNYCNDWVLEMAKYDSTKVYCGASVGGGWAWDDGSQYHVKGGARGLDWDRHAPSSDDYYSGIEFPRNYKEATPNNSPIIAHEQGQWCVFPDFKEISQYAGAYKARNFEIFRDLLAAGGMESQAEKFLHASGKLQVLCYKYEIERNLRTKDYTGFQLLGLNDYSGQGTALVGPLNVFWREKGYVDATQWREFCSPLVLLAHFPKFVYTNNEQLVVPVEMMNATPYRIKEVPLQYSLLWGDSVLVSGALPAKPIGIGKNNQMGTVRCSLASLPVPSKLTLMASLGSYVINRWDFWVYPSDVSVGVEDESLVISDELDDKALQALERGGTVLLTAAGRVTLGSDVKQTYLPVFWNTSWFKMRPPHTTGAYIDTKHPLFKYDFPTDDWSNLNWWELLNKAQVMNLRELPADYQPPIQPIDTWHVSRKLGMLIEARVGQGRLLMTTMDITTDLEHRHVARQMRQAILRYMTSEDFQPKLTLKPEVIRHFYTEQAPPVNMFTNDSPDELKPKLK